MMHSFDVPAFDSSAMLFSGHDIDYQQLDVNLDLSPASSACTAAALFAQPTPPLTYASPTFTDETLYTPPPSMPLALPNVKVKLEQDCYQSIIDPTRLRYPPWSIPTAPGSSMVDQSGSKNWSRVQGKNVSTMNPQDILLPEGQQHLAPTFLTDAQTSPLSPFSRPSLFHIPPNTHPHAHPQHCNFGPHTLQYNKHTMNVTPLDIDEALRMHFSHGDRIASGTVNPRDVCSYTGFNIAPPPPLSLSADVEGIDDEDAEEANRRTCTYESDEEESPLKVKTEPVDDDNIPQSLNNGYQSAPSILQLPMYTFTAPTPYELMGCGLTSKWQDYRGETWERQYDMTQISKELTEGRQYHQAMKQSQLADPAASSTKRKQVRRRRKQCPQCNNSDDTSLGNYVAQDQSKGLIDANTGRARMACKSCHRSKAKCTVERPACQNCIKKGVPCEYPAFIRRRGKAKRSRNATYQVNTAATSSTSLSPPSSGSVSASMSTSTHTHVPTHIPLSLLQSRVKSLANSSKKPKLEYS